MQRSNSGFLQPPQRTFSPAQSTKSGQRLYNNANFYHNRRKELKEQREYEIKSQMKVKPTINKKSIDLLGAKLRLRERQFLDNNNDFCKKTSIDETSHNHDICYFNRKKCEEIKECTHVPKIN
jgi:hypothetical protein